MKFGFYIENYLHIVFLKKRPAVPIMFNANNYKVEILDCPSFYWLNNLKHFPELDVCLFNTPILPAYKPTRAIVIALDFAYLLLPKKNIQDWVRLIANYTLNWYAFVRAWRVVSISEATRRDLIKFFPIKKEKIIVIPLGFNDICALKQEFIRLPKNFFFYVGAIKERKNVLNSVKAFHYSLKSLSDDFRFVLAGKYSGEYYNQIRDYIEKNNLAQKIIFVGAISDAQLCYAYKNAHALIYPSFVEGFGFPILEAFACGLPVITSNQSSLSEVAGNSALLVNPRDIEDIAGAMIKFANNEPLRQEYIKMGYNRVKEFSWQKTAIQILKITKQS